MFSEKYIFEQTPGILVKFCHPSDLRLWRTGMLLLTKTKGHMSNVHYSGFPKHLQTKSNLHISISQSKLKHKCQPLDSGHPVSNCNPQHMYSCIFTICINLHLFFSWNFDFSVKQSSRQPQKAFPCNFNHTTQSRALPKQLTLSQPRGQIMPTTALQVLSGSNSLWRWRLCNQADDLKKGRDRIES